MDRRTLRWIFPPALAAAALLLFVINSDSGGDGTLRLSGTIEATEVAVSFQTGGRIARRLVDEGDAVRRGDCVARLVSDDLAQQVTLREAEQEGAQAALAELQQGYRAEEIAQALAGVEEARARLDELLEGSRQEELHRARAAVERARSEYRRLEKDFRRAEKLLEDQVITQQSYDRSYAAYQVAKARLLEAKASLQLVRQGPREQRIAQARAQLKKARERYGMLRQGPRKETVAQAAARVKQARAALAVARIRLGYATLTAPLDGVVLTAGLEAGEYAAPGTPVVTVARLDEVWMRAYIGETDLGRVELGQPVRVTTDSYPDRTYPGRVTFIASEAEFTPKMVRTEEERVRLVYRIKITLPNPDGELKPGMPADATLSPEPAER